MEASSEHIEALIEREILNATKSLCPICKKIVDAVIFRKDSQVWIEKKCDKHGLTEDVYWGSYELYKKASRYACSGRRVLNPNVVYQSCPESCGMCREHLSHSALVNLVVTNRCNLSCWYCFFYAQKQGYVYEPSLEQIKKMLRVVKNEKPVPSNAIQLTGGEPTLRQDLTEIIKLAKEEGFSHVQLNSNGIALAHDPELVRKIRNAGTNTLYLSFDGVTPETNPKNHYEIPGIIENCRRAKLGIVLVPTIIRGINDHEVGEIIKFASANIDIVRSVNFQPVSLVRRMTRSRRMKHRITIPDVIERIEEQTDGEIAREDFYPVPYTASITRFVESITRKPQYELSAHFACGMATYAFKENGKLIPITRFINVEGLFEYLNEKAGEISAGGNKYLTKLKMLRKLGGFIDKEKKPKSFNITKTLYNILLRHSYGALGKLHEKTLFIGLMHFQDLYNYDIERVKRCCIHYVTPDKRLIPFCAFNVLPELYRGRIQKKYSIPSEEWERVTGKKLRDDL